MKPILHTKLQRVHIVSGFSLIEVLVSLSIFTVVMIISVGSLMVLIGANARAQNSQAAITNISYMLDSMTREIRTGTDYYCAASGSLPTAGGATQDCANSSSFAFNEGGRSLTRGLTSNRIAYRLNGSVVERRLSNQTWLPVTSRDITVTSLRFVTSGSTRNDAVAPTVTIFLSGTAGDASDDTLTEFDVQTTVVQQSIDL